MSTRGWDAGSAVWLDELDADELRELLRVAASRIPDMGDWLAVQGAARADDPSELLEIVNRVLSPRRRFYEYRQANDYAADAYDTVELLAARALRGSPGLVRVIERAITLVTRAILKSDDSSGAQGDLVHILLEAHATATRTSSPPLTRAEQKRLITWLINYRYGGTQDFFDPDIVTYAPGLSTASIDQYRQAIAGIDLGPYGSYPLTRLAVLDRDRDAILAANGGEPDNSLLAARIVSDLEEAGLHGDAVDYARRGVAMSGRGWDQKLVTFLVDDAFSRGDVEQAVSLRRDWFARFPGSSTFAALRESAERVGVWDEERESAEALLAERDAAAYATYLLGEDRVDQAWDFATATVAPTDRAGLWLDLCTKRAQTHPSDTLPIYRTIVADTLTVTDKRNYRSAASILTTMRAVAASAGPESTAEFDAFLAKIIDQNRRRPTCIDTFARAGLIRRN